MADETGPRHYFESTPLCRFVEEDSRRNWTVAGALERLIPHQVKEDYLTRVYSFPAPGFGPPSC
jgi:hypothetical protein